MSTAEPWLDKTALARHLCCSVRSIQTAMAEGMPYTVIFGRAKFKVSRVEPWLEAYGHLADHSGDTLAADDERPGGALSPRAKTRGDGPHAEKAA